VDWAVPVAGAIGAFWGCLYGRFWYGRFWSRSRPPCVRCLHFMPHEGACSLGVHGRMDLVEVTSCRMRVVMPAKPTALPKGCRKEKGLAP